MLIMELHRNFFCILPSVVILKLLELFGANFLLPELIITFLSSSLQRLYLVASPKDLGSMSRLNTNSRLGRLNLKMNGGGLVGTN